MKAEGQKETSELYKINEYGKIQHIGKVYYNFTRQRYAKRYPFSIETTGHVTIDLLSIKVVEL